MNEKHKIGGVTIISSPYVTDKDSWFLTSEDQIKEVLFHRSNFPTGPFGTVIDEDIDSKIVTVAIDWGLGRKADLVEEDPDLVGFDDSPEWGEEPIT